MVYRRPLLCRMRDLDDPVRRPAAFAVAATTATAAFTPTATDCAFSARLATRTLHGVRAACVRL